MLATMHPLALVLLCLGWATQTVALELMWPTGPTVGAYYSVRWNNGKTPYKMDIHNMNTSLITYTYTGDDNITYWTVDVPASTIVRFQITDATGLSVTSDPVTVLPDPVSSSISASSVSVERLSSISQSLVSASLASVASVSSISVTSVRATSTDKPNPGSTIPSGPTQTGSSPNRGGNQTGKIIGGVVGGVLGVGAVALICFYLVMRRQKYSRIPLRQGDPDNEPTNAIHMSMERPGTLSASDSLFPSQPGAGVTGSGYAPVPTSLPPSFSQQQQPSAYGSPARTPYETYQRSSSEGLPQIDETPAQLYNFGRDNHGFAGLPEL